MSAPDRSIVARLLAVVPVIAERVGALLAAANENPQLRADLAAALADRDQARTDLAADEQGDTDALAPLAAAVDALDRLVAPAAQADPDVVPVTDPADVPAVADGDLPVDSTDGRTDADVDGNTAPTE